MKQKTLGIDARFYGEAGPGRYVKNIIQHLEKVDTQNKYFIFLTKKSFDTYIPKYQNFQKVLADHPWYSWNEQIFFLLKLLRFNLDLLYVPHFNIPVLYPKKIVTAIPDVIMHTYSTEKGTTLPIWYFKFKKIVYKYVLLWAAIRSKKVIVPSKVTLNDFRFLFPWISQDKYVLAEEGVDPDYTKLTVDPQKILADLEVRKPFLLNVGSAYEHKNIPRLIDAFKILCEKYGFTGQLIIVGKKDKFSKSVFDKIVAEKLKNRVLMPGLKKYVTDEQVIALRKEAEIYVFPSLMEGFSLTPMESQAVGLACAISDIPIHREIYDNSVLYFDPRDPQDMAKKINRLLSDKNLKKDLIAKGLKQIKKYDWYKTAKKTLEVFESILN